MALVEFTLSLVESAAYLLIAYGAVKVIKVIFRELDPKVEK